MSDQIEPPLCTTSTQHMTSCEALFYECHDIFIMNDMDAQTGCVKPSSVVYVKRFRLESKVVYSCTCETYQHVKSTSLTSPHLETTTSGNPCLSTCVHCKYLDMHIENPLKCYRQPGISQ